jgi:pimeloyl-ACP methyl ester carboxylesterase
MARPPSYVSIPDKSGIFRVDERETMYYELRGPAASSTKAGTDFSGATYNKEPCKAGRRVVLVMGAFGTLRWVDFLADKLAAEGYQVLSYNHRGIGGGCCGARAGSGNEEEEQGEEDERATWGDLGHHHTCKLLAQDAWHLIDHVWGDSVNEKIHLYGASMGGFVVQQMALQDLRAAEQAHRPPRIASLFMAVTSRGIFSVPGLNVLSRFFLPVLYHTGLIRLVTPLLIASSKERMLQSLLEKCFSPAYLASVHESSGDCMRAVWERAWSENYDSWNCFHQPQACLNQIMALASHHLSDQDAEMLHRHLPGKITIQIATQDRIIPARKQEALAQVLQARRIVVNGGHMLDSLEPEAYWADVMMHFVEEEEEGK